MMRTHLAALSASILLGACASSPSPDGPEHPDPLHGVAAEELFQRGRALLGLGDYVRAEQYLAAAMDRGYPEPEAMPPLIDACVRSGRFVAALSYAEPYLERHPHHWALRLLVASIHMGMQHPRIAREHLEGVIRDAPADHSQAHYYLGVLFRDDLEDPEASRNHFRQYIALAPDGVHSEEAAAALQDDTNQGGDSPAPEVVPTEVVPREVVPTEVVPREAPIEVPPTDEDSTEPAPQEASIEAES